MTSREARIAAFEIVIQHIELRARRARLKLSRAQIPGRAADVLRLAKAMDERLRNLNLTLLRQCMVGCGCRFGKRKGDRTIAKLFPEVFGD
jgi:hypothetical protein